MAKLIITLEGGIKKELELTPGREFILGRGSQSDVVLTNSKISRQHARLSFEDGHWKCIITSKFGQITVNKVGFQKIELTPGLNFSIDPYELQFIASDENNVATPDVTATKTQLGKTNLEAFLKKIDANNEIIAEIPLKTSNLVAGRSSSCDLVLEDTHSSRRHFAIEYDGRNYFIKDLVSANKTYVNDRAIEEHTLQSGDVIRVGEERFVFEIVDPDLMHLPPAVFHTSGSEQADENSPAVIKYRIDEASLAPVKMEISKENFEALVHSIRSSNKMKARVAIGILALVGILVGIFSGNKQAPSQRSVAGAAGLVPSAYDHLPPDQKKYIDETYNLALNLYTTGKYDLAAIEIGKVIQIVGTYKDAKNIQALCQQAIEIKKQQDEADRQDREQAGVKQQVSDILDRCEGLLKAKKFQQVEACVAQTSELDPDNERAQNLVLSAKQEMESIADSKARRAEIAHHNAYVTSIYIKAKQDYAAKRFPAALNKLEIVEKQASGETSALRQKAKEDIAKTKEEMLKESNELVSQAKSSLDSKEYKTAIIKFNKALELAPFNSEAKSMREQAASALHQDMKNLYSESVIEENLGNIDSAKSKWSRIIHDDEKGDQYFEKAQIKLRKYDK